MGSIVDWLGVLFIGTIWGVFLAVKVPLRGACDNIKPSNLLWVGCALSAFAIGMLYAFGPRTVRSPLVFLFFPAFAGGTLLYGLPLSKARQPSKLRWLLRWVLAGLAVCLFFAFGTRALQSPVVFITIPAFARAMVIDWFSSRAKRV